MEYSRILVCGARDYNKPSYFREQMDRLVKSHFADKFVIIHGGHGGVNILAAQWAALGDYPTLEIRGNTPYYHSASERIQNQWLMDWGRPDLVLAFPGGRNTEDIVRHAKERGIHVIPF